MTPGSAPELRERLQGKINAFIRPTASLPGRYPHTHTEPPRGPVHPEVNPKFFSLDKLGSRESPRVGDSYVHG